MTYLEATYSQKMEDFITSREKSLYYIGGIPNDIITDNHRRYVLMEIIEEWHGNHSTIITSPITNDPMA